MSEFVWGGKIDWKGITDDTRTQGNVKEMTHDTAQTHVYMATTGKVLVTQKTNKLEDELMANQSTDLTQLEVGHR